MLHNSGAFFSQCWELLPREGKDSLQKLFSGLNNFIIYPEKFGYRIKEGNRYYLNRNILQLLNRDHQK